MNIYISGISGTGMGPLALMAAGAGLSVQGSDLAAGAVLPELQARGIPVTIGPQDGTNLEKLLQAGQVDWFVHTSALPPNHPELTLAHKYGIKVSKRDELIAYLLDKLQLNLVAVAGTHGKTTTTSMIIWACLQLNIPVSYLVGTTLPFAPAGNYQPGARFFIYEADEYDRNFLHFHPWLSVITSVSYDHPDIYPTEQSYQEAFQQFAAQSQAVITPADLAAAYLEHLHNFPPNLPPLDALAASLGLNLAGAVRRVDAALALLAVQRMAPEVPLAQIVATLNQFPGVGRRFERIAPGVYTDYAHHPEEVQVTIQTALEEATRLGHRGVVAIYQPHQNTRQHSVRQGYRRALTGVDKIYWLPTYLTREDVNLPILTPQELLSGLENSEVGVTAELNSELASSLQEALEQGYLVLLMTAGPADEWLRENFSTLPVRRLGDNESPSTLPRRASDA